MQSKEIYAQTVRFFLQPVLVLLDDPTVSEILINGPEQIYFERAGRLHRSQAKFPTEGALLAAARNIAEYVNRQIDQDHHSMDGRLPDGSRVHVIIPPSSRQGVCISLRKFQKSLFNLQSLVQKDSISDEAAEFLEIIVQLHKNTVIAGGTGTGKTSMLNALSTAIPEHERIIVIEDSSELQLHQPHTIYLEAQPPRPGGKGGVSIRDLFVDSLRMRPDRIVVGEVRRGEALDLIQSMLSGHSGSLTTVHASTPRDAAIRLETLCLMSDVGLPAHVARLQVASALQLVVQLARFGDGSRRVQSISEVLGVGSDGEYRTQDLYVFQAAGIDAQGRVQGALRPTGAACTFRGEPQRMGLGAKIRLTQRIFSPAATAGNEKANAAQRPAPSKTTIGKTDGSADMTRDLVKVVACRKDANPTVETLTVTYQDKNDRIRLQVEALRTILGAVFQMHEYPPALRKPHLAVWGNAGVCIVARKHPQGGYQTLEGAELSQVAADLQQHRPQFFS